MIKYFLVFFRWRGVVGRVKFKYVFVYSGVEGNEVVDVSLIVLFGGVMVNFYVIFVRG